MRDPSTTLFPYTTLFRSVCEYMHTALRSLVEALEACPGKAVLALEVLPEAERQQVLYEWNRTEADFPGDKCVHELFEEQVRSEEHTSELQSHSDLVCRLL